MRISLLAVLIGLLAARASAQPADELPAHAELLADVSAIAPGQTSTVGVLFTMKPQWHIYWKNPGDSGIPTAITFAGPAGFTISELRWPVPSTFTQPGEIVGYGYSGSVLLSAKVKAPEGLAIGSQVTLTADVEWLCCHDTCIPGEAKLRLVLPVAQAASPANQTLFSQWEDRLPIDIASLQSPVRAEFTGRWQADAPTADYTITLTWRDSPAREVAFYPAPGPAMDVRNIRITSAQASDPATTAVSLTATLLKGKTMQDSRLPAVIAFTDGAGHRRGVRLAVPLK